MQIKTAQAEKFLAAPSPSLRALLLYGPDGGLVQERAAAAVAAVIGPGDDPFRLVELTAAQLQDDPARLSDEAAALAFTGGLRVVRIRGGGEGLLAHFKRFLKELPGEALVVVEAGDLPRRAAMVKLFEIAGEEAAAVACYRDEGRDLQRLIGETLHAAGISATPDALTYLVANLGGDRQVTRRELEKLVLLMRGRQDPVELADAVASVGDTAALTLDDLAFAVADGDPAAADRALRRSLREGTAPVTILRAVARHFARLHLVSGQMAGGVALDGALRKLRPPLFWKVADRFKRQLRAWPTARLALALRRLIDVEAQCKQTGAPDVVLCQMALLTLAAQARTQNRQRR
jgi:DNA polymerase-3 subunit delta